LFKREKRNVVYATQTGQVLPIEKISDSVFAKKVLGDGVFIIPDNEKVYAPITGRLRVVSNSKHAYGIVGQDGIELLVHIGIDSVDLNGEGFKSYVNVGDKVKAGDLLCEIDFQVFEKANISTETAIVIANNERFKIIERNEMPTVAGITEIFRYEQI